MAEQQKFELVAFIIQRFCGGKIEFTLDEFCSALQHIDVQRFCRDGKVTYITRPGAGPPDEPL